ncbi:hypothetical protein AGMMS49982_23890 [Bacteroidia bacterium]|nr:hypothetical protein AGMMS49982_23890 [Bacteroidia bacterium]
MALSALLFAGCSSDNDSEVTPGVKNSDYVGDGVIEFSSGRIAELRVSEASGIVSWSNNDEIAIAMVNTGALTIHTGYAGVVYKTPATLGGSLGSFTHSTTTKLTYPSGLTSANFDFVAIYPTPASASTTLDTTSAASPGDLEKISINLANPAQQKDWMVAFVNNGGGGYNKSADAGTTIPLAFEHLLTKLVLRVTKDPTDTDVPDFNIAPNQLDVFVTGSAVNTTAEITFHPGAKPTIETEAAPSTDIKATLKGTRQAILAEFEVFLFPIGAAGPGTYLLEFRVGGRTFLADLSTKINSSSGLEISKKYTLNAELRGSSVSLSATIGDFDEIAPWTGGFFE